MEVLNPPTMNKFLQIPSNILQQSSRISQNIVQIAQISNSSFPSMSAANLDETYF